MEKKAKRIARKSGKEPKTPKCCNICGTCAHYTLIGVNKRDVEGVCRAGKSKVVEAVTPACLHFVEVDQQAALDRVRRAIELAIRWIIAKNMGKGDAHANSQA